MFKKVPANGHLMLLALVGLLAEVSTVALARDPVSDSAPAPPGTLGGAVVNRHAESHVSNDDEIDVASKTPSPSTLRAGAAAFTGPPPTEPSAFAGPGAQPFLDLAEMSPAPSGDNELVASITSDCSTPPPCNRCGPLGGNCISCLLETQFFVDAWLAQGFTWNPASPTNIFNLPVTFNDRANEYQLNQIYISLGREVCRNRCAWDLGGRVDLLFGTDYFFTTATGLETHQDGSPKWNSGDGPRGAGAALYGLAMPQLYAEVFAPIGNGLSVKLGHFYTIMGYESVMAPENFFYSHAYTMQYGEPFTHTGLLAAYNVSPFGFQAGFTRGWDTWEDPVGNLAFLGGVKWTCPDGCTTVAFSLHTGDEDADGDNRTAYRLVCTRRLNRFLTYVLQHDLGVEQNAAIKPTGPDKAMWYGINQYLLCDATEDVTIGLRIEWFRDQDNARVLGIPIATQTDGGNYFALTAGLNWKPRRNITFRPEIRWDHSNVAGPPAFSRRIFNDFTDTDQLTIAADLIFEL